MTAVARIHCFREGVVAMYRHLRTPVFAVALFAIFMVIAASDGGDKPKERVLREWTDTTGTYQIDAEFRDYRDGKVYLRRDDGVHISVPMSRLSHADRAFVRAELKRRKSARGDSDVQPKPSVDAEPINKLNDGRDLSRGLGVLPLDPARTYIHVEGDPAPKPEDAVRCRFADPHEDIAPLVEAERMRLKTGNARHFEWEQKIGYDLVRVETHHIVVHAQLPVEEARRVGMALEAMKIHLQKLTGNLVLTPLRPDIDEMVIVFGKFRYLDLLKIIEQMYPGKLGDSWHLLPELAGGTVDRTSFSYTQRGGWPPAHMAVFQAGGRSIRKATDSRAPYWLVEGFAAYCERAVLRQNLVHSVRYENKDVLIGNDWLLAAHTLARAGKLTPWDEMLARDLRDYQLVHYVQACAMVAYFFESDPQKFLDFAEQIKLGRNSKQALETAYGVPVRQLEDKWLEWLKQGR
jgi:hypothetical protein